MQICLSVCLSVFVCCGCKTPAVCLPQPFTHSLPFCCKPSMVVLKSNKWFLLVLPLQFPFLVYLCSRIITHLPSHLPRGLACLPFSLLMPALLLHPVHLHSACLSVSDCVICNLIFPTAAGYILSSVHQPHPYPFPTLTLTKQPLGVITLHHCKGQRNRKHSSLHFSPLITAALRANSARTRKSCT